MLPTVESSSYHMRAVAHGTELVSVSHMLANHKQSFLIHVPPVNKQKSQFTRGDLLFLTVWFVS